MKINASKMLLISAFLIFLGAGVSLAGGWKGDCGPRGNAYGHYKQGGYHHYHYAPPRPVYVERHYYRAPVYYAAPVPPPPSGFFFGMSVADAGSAFSFGVSGR
jgi:hypothetical protein